ncbi:MAG: OmpA family protein [Desulfobacterales bacterium]|nr:OmpA family protein [Desulfobacterales bacterium]
MKCNSEKAAGLVRFTIAFALAATGFWIFTICISSTALATDAETVRQQASSAIEQTHMVPESIAADTEKVDTPILEEKRVKSPVLEEQAFGTREQSVDKRAVSVDSQKSPSEEETRQFLSRQVFFAFNSSQLDEQAQALIREQAAWLAANPDVGIEIIGYCDQSGPQDYNMVLGKKRANAVKTFLERLGIAPQRLTEVSYGEQSPIRTTTNQTAARINRRVEFKIQPSA